MELKQIGDEVSDDKDSAEDVVIVVHIHIHIHHSYYYYHYYSMMMKMKNLKTHMKKHVSSYETLLNYSLP
jgi:hypothetical protein